MLYFINGWTCGLSMVVLEEKVSDVVRFLYSKIGDKLFILPHSCALLEDGLEVTDCSVALQKKLFRATYYTLTARPDPLLLVDPLPFYHQLALRRGATGLSEIIYDAMLTIPRDDFEFWRFSSNPEWSKFFPQQTGRLTYMFSRTLDDGDFEVIAQKVVTDYTSYLNSVQ